MGTPARQTPPVTLATWSLVCDPATLVPVPPVAEPSSWKKRMSKIASFISKIATSFLPIVAIVFAVVQFVDSRLLKNEIKHVVQSMSTEYIAEFPWNIEEIDRVISNAKKELDIMVDAAAYGQYSRPKLSEE